MLYVAPYEFFCKVFNIGWKKNYSLAGKKTLSLFESGRAIIAETGSESKHGYIKKKLMDYHNLFSSAPRSDIFKRHVKSLAGRYLKDWSIDYKYTGFFSSNRYFFSSD